MIRLSLAVLALGMLCVACGGGAGAGGTPEATFKAAQSAVGSENWSALFDLMTPEGHKEFEGEMKEVKENPEFAAMMGIEADELESMELRDFFCKMMEMMAKEEGDDLEQFADAEFKSAEIDGDNAKVKFTMGEDDEETMEMKLVDGKWMITELG